MKVLNLQCGHGHSFEGWFGSEDDFQNQLARSLIECPICADTGIQKMLSAPRLNLGASAPMAQEPTNQLPALAQAVSTDASEQAQWLQMVRHVMAHTEDVGERFSDLARRMHYGETDHRQIRGQATLDQTRELLDEGIAVMPLPVPAAFKGPLH
jgi:hypothetical protein